MIRRLARRWSSGWPPTTARVCCAYRCKLRWRLSRPNASQQAEQLIDEASPWWPIRDGIRARANASQDNPTPASHFARNLLAAVQSNSRPNLLRLGNGSRSLPLLAALLPKHLLEAVLKKRFGLNRSL